MKKAIVVICVEILFLVVYLSGCVSSLQDIILDDSYYQNASRDPVNINNVKLHRNILYVNVSYSGGCKEHEFTLIASSFMESNPVQVNILLSHNDNNDPCDMWITEEMAFNLIPLKKGWQCSYLEKSGIIILNIQGWEESIYYDF